MHQESSGNVQTSPFSPIWAIGTPGRAAVELPAGPPSSPPGWADVELSAVAWPGIEVRAASVRGIQHRAAAEPRQDAFAAGVSTDASGTAVLVTAVCDGVGALAQSHEAASLAAHALVTSVATDENLISALVETNALLKASTHRNGDNQRALDRATTASVLRVRREGDYWVGAFASVGDSPLWHLSDTGSWSCLTRSESDENKSDEYHSTATQALPAASLECEERHVRVHGGSLFLMSDGVGNPLAWADEVQHQLAQWWSRPPDIFTFGAQVGFARKGHMDDRTCVGVWPTSANAPGEEG
jgi:serine/threonine protein phosphatase PrpC